MEQIANSAGHEIERAILIEIVTASLIEALPVSSDEMPDLARHAPRLFLDQPRRLEIGITKPTRPFSRGIRPMK